MIKLTKILSELFEQTPDSRGGKENIGDPGVYGASVNPDAVSTPSKRGETRITKTDEDGDLILPSYKPGGLAGQTLWIDPAEYRDKTGNAPGLGQKGHSFQTPIKAALSSGTGRIYIWNDKNPTLNKKMLNQIYLGIDIDEYKKAGGILRGLSSADTRGGAEDIVMINNKYRLGDLMIGSAKNTGRKTMLPSYQRILTGRDFVPRAGKWYAVTLDTVSPEHATGSRRRALVHYQGVGTIGQTSPTIINAYMGEGSQGKTMTGMNIVEDPAGDAAIQNVLAGKDPLGRDFSRKNKNIDQQQHWATVKRIIEKGV